jgi:hypothetical protein
MKSLEYCYYTWEYLEPIHHLVDMPIPKAQQQEYNSIKLDIGM